MNNEDLSDGTTAGSPAPRPDASWSPESAPFTPVEKAWMLRVARESILRHVTGMPPLEADAPPSRLMRKQSCFVTLTLAGALRGCIGSVSPLLPLCQGVAEHARAAASRDPRFPAVTRHELDELKIEISVLTDPEPVTFESPEDLLSKLQPGVCGVVLRIEGLVGTFLPQVWAQVPDRTLFLNRLAEKIGFPPDAWRSPGISVSLYKVESFEEE